MLIRKITTEDIEIINKTLTEDYWRKSIWLPVEFSTFDFTPWFWDPWYIAIEWERILWFITGDSDSFRWYCEIVRLYVFPENRRKWVWSELVESICKYFSSIWMEAVELLTYTEDNKNFYLKNWFLILTEYEKPYVKRDFKKRILMYKKL